MLYPHFSLQLPNGIKTTTTKINVIFFSSRMLNPWIRLATRARFSCPVFPIRTPNTDRSEISNFGLFQHFCYPLKNVKCKSSRQTIISSYHSEREFYYPDEKNVPQENKNLGEHKQQHNGSEHVILLGSTYSTTPAFGLWWVRKIAFMYSFHIKQGDRGAKGPRGSPGRTGRAVSR